MARVATWSAIVGRGPSCSRTLAPLSCSMNVSRFTGYDVSSGT